MVVVMLPEIQGPGFAGYPRVPVPGFLRGRPGFWVPAAPAGNARAVQPAPERIRPDGGTETVLQVGEGLESHGGDSGPSSGPDAGEDDTSAGSFR